MTADGSVKGSDLAMNHVQTTIRKLLQTLKDGTGIVIKLYSTAWLYYLHEFLTGVLLERKAQIHIRKVLRKHSGKKFKKKI